MIVNAEALKGIFDGFSMAFNKGFAGADTAYGLIAMTVNSTHASENYGWMSLIPGLREWVGPRLISNLGLHGYAVRNKDFEQTISVDRNAIEDDSYGVFSPLFGELGRAAAELPDKLVFKTLAAGFTTECYDEQPFFDAEHPVAVGDNTTVSQSNVQTGSDPAWFLMDTSRAVRPMVYQERRPFGQLIRKDQPTDDNVFWSKELIYGSDGRGNVGYGLWQLAFASKAPLNAENYEAARVAMMSRLGDEGRTLNIKPNILVCGPELEGAAMRLLNNGTRLVTEVDGDPLDAPVAVQNEWAGTAKPIVTNWLNA